MDTKIDTAIFDISIWGPIMLIMQQDTALGRVLRHVLAMQNVLTQRNKPLGLQSKL